MELGSLDPNFVHYVYDNFPWVKITILDKMTYAGNIDNIKELLGKE